MKVLFGLNATCGSYGSQTDCLRLAKKLPNIHKCSDYDSQMKFHGFIQALDLTKVVPKED